MEEVNTSKKKYLIERTLITGTQIAKKHGGVHIQAHGQLQLAKVTCGASPARVRVSACFLHFRTLVQNKNTFAGYEVHLLSTHGFKELGAH